MEGLANPEIGGFFDVILSGQGAARAQAVVGLVRGRFSQMYIVRWRVSCIASSVTQSFKLAFTNTTNYVNGDATFDKVPVGIDPKSWPLDINVDYTKQMADREPIRPGGEFTIYGNFCWGGESSRAEVYFIPSGSQLPADLASADLNKAQAQRQHLIASRMNGKALQSTDGNVKFEAPDNAKILWGSGKQAVVRLVVYDSGALRASGVTIKTVLELKGADKALPMLLVGGIGFGALVLALLGVLLFRGGGGRRRAAGPAPAPIVASGGSFSPGGGSPRFSPMGAPPGGGMGAPPMGGGMGAPPMGGGMGPAPAAPGAGGPGGPYYGASPLGPPPFAPGGSPPAQPAPAASPDFMYGGQPPQYGLTGAQAAAQAPPPDPYGQQPAPYPQPDPYGQQPAPYAQQPDPYGQQPAPYAQQPAPYPQQPAPEAPMMGASRATLSGSAGMYTVLPGFEMLAGRDAARCQIVLSEPRVSGLHARLKMENGQLFVMDEQSNNGTFVDGQRLGPQVWTLVAHGSVVRFGPVEFVTRLE
jgi:hypothetical protein